MELFPSAMILPLWSATCFPRNFSYSCGLICGASYMFSGMVGPHDRVDVEWCAHLLECGRAY